MWDTTCLPLRPATGLTDPHLEQAKALLRSPIRLARRTDAQAPPGDSFRGHNPLVFCLDGKGRTDLLPLRAESASTPPARPPPPGAEACTLRLVPCSRPLP